jgi:hypothetical protein
MEGTFSAATAQGSGPMGKAMSIAGMVIGGLIAIAFALDLVLEIPFGGKGGGLAHIGMALCGAILAYLAFDSFREAK